MTRSLRSDAKMHGHPPCVNTLWHAIFLLQICSANRKDFGDGFVHLSKLHVDYVFLITLSSVNSVLHVMRNPCKKHIVVVSIAGTADTRVNISPALQLSAVACTINNRNN